MNIYALHDSNQDLKEKNGCFLIRRDQAKLYNSEGYGIFFTPNIFEGSRKVENLIEIKYWFADIDKGTKEEQMIKIKKLLMKPTLIVESKRGYHLYWKAKNATVDNFRVIMEGIIKKLDADEAVKGLNRTMRLPGYCHMKDMQNPFMVNIIHKSKEEYTEKEMLYAFGFKKPVKKLYQTFNLETKEEMLKPENWDKIFWLNRIGNGNRNNEFARITLWLKDEGFDRETIRQTVYEMNRRIYEPLEERELNTILKGKI